MVYRMHSNLLMALAVLAITSPQIVNGGAAQPDVLNMDIQWVMQGYNFGFQGFMVEFLGFSSAIRGLLPQTRLVQSSFRKTFDDYPVGNITKFFSEDMFPREGNDSNWLYTKEQPQVPEGGYTIPSSKVFPPATINESIVCDSPSESIAEDTVYSGSDLARFLVSSAANPRLCCKACVANPICLAWSFDGRQCRLKGSMPQYVLSQTGATSGHLMQRPGGRYPTPRALILHGTTCFHNNLTITRKDSNTITIGRYMMEREEISGTFSIDELAVLSCSTLVDEIWVPTEWSKRSFMTILKSMGVPNPSIFVIPEAVDTVSFDPALSPNSRFDFQITSCTPNPSVSNTEENMQQQVEGVDSCAISSVERPFQFLSIFKWEYRKGWDILLNAYWDAFEASDNVILRLRTYLPPWQRGHTNITDAIRDFAWAMRGKSLSELAPVEWVSGSSPSKLSDSMTRMDVRDLLASADSFVLPTRGEGWGLPIAEAMAMALPVIVTNYSGPTGYATEENCYLLPILPGKDEQNFARPDPAALARLLRQVVEESKQAGGGSAAAKGKAARATMQKISPEYVVSMMASRLREHAWRRGWSSL